MKNHIARRRRGGSSRRSLPTWAAGRLAAAVALLLTVTLAPTAQARPMTDAPVATASTSYVLHVPEGDAVFDSATGLTDGVPRVGRIPIDLPRIVTLSGRVNSGTEVISDWLSALSPTLVRPDLTVTQVAQSGQVLHTYRLLDVLPVNWSITALDAGASEVATTTLVLSCRRVEIVS